MLYTVTWDIDIDADSPEEAAKLALEIQRDPNSTATYFSVETFGRPGIPKTVHWFDAADEEE